MLRLYEFYDIESKNISTCFKYDHICLKKTYRNLCINYQVHSELFEKVMSKWVLNKIIMSSAKQINFHN